MGKNRADAFESRAFQALGARARPQGASRARRSDAARARMGPDDARATCALCPSAPRARRPKKALRRCLDALDADEWLAPVLVDDRDDAPSRFHQACALWCPEVYFDGERGRLRRVRDAARRARRLRCARCGERGAAIGCAVDECPKSYHLVCAHEDGCSFALGEFALACARHAGRLARERPNARWADVGVEDVGGEGAEGGGSGDGANGASAGARPAAAVVAAQAAPGATPILNRIRAGAEISRGRKQKGKKKKRVKMNDDRFMNTREGEIYRAVVEAGIRLRAEEERGQGPIEDDDEAFRLRESRRLEKDKEAIPRVVIGGGIGTSIYSQGWDSLAGMEEHVKILKELTLLPLTYPEMFERLGAGAARGVLLHGPPGTGKTAAVRALLGAAAKGPRPISFFSRLGADCLGKYSGEAERKLRLLFEEAEKRQPSIIFFDEIDGLAPARRGSGGSGAQDEIHSSVVATLLALMDGLSGRGSVVVIASTNRPDAVDPALRRPGRFDRELFFGLPDSRARAEILAVHTRAWTPQPSRDTLAAVAARTEGCAGADLRAIANAALMSALKRSCPSLLRGDPTRDSLAAELEARLPPPESAQMALEEAQAASAAGHIGASLTLEQFEALAKRVSVYWPIEDEHHEATIVGYDRNTARHRLQYDDSNLFDGEEVWMQLFRSNVIVRVLEYDSESADFVVGGHPQTRAATRTRVRESIERARALLESHRASRQSGVSVSPADWTMALATSSSACSARSAAAALVPRGRTLDTYLSPILGEYTNQLVTELIKRGAPLSQRTRSTEIGDTMDDTAEHTSSDGSGCRVLIAGAGDCAQREVMDVVLHSLSGTSSHLINIATLIAQGDGDAARGVAVALLEPLRQAARTKRTLVMPDLELWALARTVAPHEDGQDSAVTTSALWDLVQSTIAECYAEGAIGEQTGGLYIVATVNLPKCVLPSAVSHFFERSGVVTDVQPRLDSDSISKSVELAASVIADVDVPLAYLEARRHVTPPAGARMFKTVESEEPEETSMAACEALRIRVRRARAIVRAAIAKCVKELVRTRRFDRFFDRSEQAARLVGLALDRKIGDPHRFVKDLRACAKSMKPRKNTHTNIHKPVVSLGFNAVDTLESWLHLGVSKLYDEYVEKDAEYDEALRRAATPRARAHEPKPAPMDGDSALASTAPTAPTTVPPRARGDVFAAATSALLERLRGGSETSVARIRTVIEDARQTFRADELNRASTRPTP